MTTERVKPTTGDWPMSDAEIKKLWESHGGGFFGPHVEQACIPYEKGFYQFCRALLSHLSERRGEAMTFEGDGWEYRSALALAERVMQSVKNGQCNADDRIAILARNLIRSERRGDWQVTDEMCRKAWAVVSRMRVERIKHQISLKDGEPDDPQPTGEQEMRALLEILAAAPASPVAGGDAQPDALKYPYQIGDGLPEYPYQFVPPKVDASVAQPGEASGLNPDQVCVRPAPLAPTKAADDAATVERVANRISWR